HFPAVDIIYNMASPASPIQYKKHPLETMKTNSIGVMRLLDYMKVSGSKVFVQSSTSEVYGDPLVHPQKETYWGNVNTLGPRSCYDEGKRFAETLIMNYFHTYNLDVRLARIFNTYGPNMEKNDGRVVSNFIMQSLTKQPITIYGEGEQTRSFCYVSDMVNGLYKLAATPNLAGEVINVGNPDERTINELAGLIKEMTGTPSEIIHQPIDADDPCRRKPDISKAKELLDWEPKVSLRDGLEKAIVYFKERFL
ncbi:NAD-dependent epimerase/dehydratase family protein, partial [Candidatus Roizmanbacteria bacterium]|nr:NAD-dependent epimerase/dehydratase family protein [Candidatus Roizmanbacteria bacterium]